MAAGINLKTALPEAFSENNGYGKQIGCEAIRRLSEARRLVQPINRGQRLEHSRLASNWASAIWPVFVLRLEYLARVIVEQRRAAGKPLLRLGA